MSEKDAEGMIWISPRGLAVKKAGETNRLRGSFLLWRIHEHFYGHEKGTSIQFFA